MGDNVGMRPSDWDQKRVFDLSGAFRKGHFVLSSGRHSNVYFNKRVISGDPELLAIAGKLLADILEDANIDTIASPEEGAIPFGRAAREELRRRDKNVEYVTAYKHDDGFIIDVEDAFMVEGKRVAIVEDIFTTGGSTAKTVAAVYEAGGRTKLIVGLLDRSNGRVQELLSTLTIKALRTFYAEDWDEAECRRSGLCAQGEEICTEPKIGHGDEYVKLHRQPPYR